MIPPLAIIQARLGSTRLKNKMLLEVGGRSLIRRAWDASVEGFGEANVGFAVPSNEKGAALLMVAIKLIPHVNVFQWDGLEDDVIGRFWHCAHRYRWHPDSVIVRVTPDDPFKDSRMMLRVANGERLPVEQGAEAFTLAMLDQAYYKITEEREHLGMIFFPTRPPPPPPGVWSIVTAEDLAKANLQWTKETLRSATAYRRAADDAASGPPYGRGTGDLSDPQMGELHDTYTDPLEGL